MITLIGVLGVVVKVPVSLNPSLGMKPAGRPWANPSALEWRQPSLKSTPKITLMLTKNQAEPTDQAGFYLQGSGVIFGQIQTLFGESNVSFAYLM